MLGKNQCALRWPQIPIPIGYQETIVTPKASRNVEAYWSFTASKHGHSLILPDGRCDIIFRHNIHSTDTPTPVVTGPATQPYAVEYDVGDSWIGMRLRPSSGVALWQGKINNAANYVLRGPKALGLLPELAALNNRSLTQAKLEQALAAIQLPNVDPRLTRALDALHLSGGRMRIEKLSQFACCSTRHLNRMFRCNVGLTTKTYAQLVQFHRALNLIRSEHLPITDAAFEAGYTDHAHLTRAFRRYGGFFPSKIPQDLSPPMLPS